MKKIKKKIKIFLKKIRVGLGVGVRAVFGPNSNPNPKRFKISRQNF